MSEALVSISTINGVVEEDVLPPEAPADWPTLPLMDATVALAGAVNIVAARLSWAVFNWP